MWRRNDGVRETFSGLQSTKINLHCVLQTTWAQISRTIRGPRSRLSESLNYWNAWDILEINWNLLIKYDHKSKLLKKVQKTTDKVLCLFAQKNLVWTAVLDFLGYILFAFPRTSEAIVKKYAKFFSEELQIRKELVPISLWRKKGERQKEVQKCNHWIMLSVA